ncbi:uncharacterized protein [Primulina eburnea]|uniref:uncharacterized protein n=1 Tax=Primulina eburnea TaxID=1245227 RepID=UPI003C6C4F66
MNLLIWNCQGAASKAINRVIKDVKRRFNPRILGLIEPRVSGYQADEICKKMGFENWLRVEATGFSGGIWVFWQDDMKLEIVHTHSQFVLVRVKVGHQALWLLSIVYGSPNATLRKKLWHDLSLDNLNIEGPWCSIGDYNSVISDDEIEPQRNSAHHRSPEFADWIFNQAMIDMGFKGSKFTWTRGQSSDTHKSARLDRGLCNLEWKDMFPDSHITHLPIIQSNYAPLILNLSDKNKSESGRIFRFQAAWLTHKEFPKVIKAEWDNRQNMEDNILKMASILSNWNRTTFGNIQKIKGG